MPTRLEYSGHKRVTKSIEGGRLVWIETTLAVKAQL